MASVTAWSAAHVAITVAWGYLAVGVLTGAAVRRDCSRLAAGSARRVGGTGSSAWPPALWSAEMWAIGCLLMWLVALPEYAHHRAVFARALRA